MKLPVAYDPMNDYSWPALDYNNIIHLAGYRGIAFRLDLPHSSPSPYQLPQIGRAAEQSALIIVNNENGVFGVLLEQVITNAEFRQAGGATDFPQKRDK
jgi:hypothetical protein